MEGVWLVEGEIRLSEGTEGRLEMVKQSHWRSISDVNFENLEATVVCRQLSFRGGVVLPTVLQSKPKSEQSSDFVGNVSCMGYEQRLAECWSQQEAGSHLGAQVGVKCFREEVLNVLCSVYLRIFKI